MNKKELIKNIKEKESYLCIGLDSDPGKIPPHLLKEKDPLFAFNKAIIDATVRYAVAYKPNIAFYESLGSKGWDTLQKTLEYLPDDCFTIADAKRGDIGNTSSLYAKAFFETMSFDAVTVAPYMGADSVLPFLQYKDKWVILLALTSNPGADNFQMLPLNSGELLFEKVIRTSSSWGTDENMMYVAGATQSAMLKKIRQLLPDHFLLVPGVGAQGGDLKAVSEAALTKDCCLLVNSSRQIIYASSEKDFAKAAASAAFAVQQEMKHWLQERTDLFLIKYNKGNEF